MRERMRSDRTVPPVDYFVMGQIAQASTSREDSRYDTAHSGPTGASHLL